MHDNVEKIKKLFARKYNLNIEEVVARAKAYVGEKMLAK